MVPTTELGPTHFNTYHKTSDCSPHHNTMLGLMQYPQRVLLHKQQKRPRTFLAILKYVAAQQPTDRHSNRPIRCSTQLSRYYGRYHEHILPLFGSLRFGVPRTGSKTPSVGDCSSSWLLWHDEKTTYDVKTTNGPSSNVISIRDQHITGLGSVITAYHDET